MRFDRRPTPEGVGTVFDFQLVLPRRKATRESVPLFRKCGLPRPVFARSRNDSNSQELLVVVDNGYTGMLGNAVIAVTMVCGTAKEVVESNQLVVSLTVVMYVVIIYNLVTVGIGGMTIANIRVCVNADSCLHTDVRIAGTGKLTVGVVSPITIDDGNILTGYIVSLNSSNFIHDRFRTNSGHAEERLCQ